MHTNPMPPNQPPMPPPLTIPPLADSAPREQIDEFLPTYSMMAYMPTNQVLTRSLGLFDD